MRIVEEQANMLGRDGVRVKIQQCLHVGNLIFDTIADYFQAVGNGTEIWETRTTQRTEKPIKKSLPLRTPSVDVDHGWAETGLRSNGLLTVSTEDPLKIDKNNWQQPKGYLSHVYLHLMPPLLPRNREMTMAFYTYNPHEKKISLTHHPRKPARQRRLPRLPPAEPEPRRAGFDLR